MPRYLDRQRVADAVELYALLLQSGMTHEEALQRMSVSYGPDARKPRKRAWWRR